MLRLHLQQIDAFAQAIAEIDKEVEANLDPAEPANSPGADYGIDEDAGAGKDHDASIVRYAARAASGYSADEEWSS